MKARIYHRVTQENGTQEEWEEVFDSPTITIGRGTDQIIHLPDPRIAHHHATVKRVDRNRLVIKVSGMQTLLVNEHLRLMAELQPGDVIRLFSYTITILEPHESDDARFRVEQTDTIPNEQPTLEKWTKLSQTYLSKRRWSWILASAVLVIFLGLPLLAYLDPYSKELLDKTILPSDTSWSSGPLSRHHQFIGLECNVCHESAFQRVKNKSCLICHENTTQHIRAVINFDNIPASHNRCEYCHKEHNEPASLTREDNDLCVNCHDDINQHLRQFIDIKNVKDFGLEHPNFRYQTFEPSLSNQQWVWSPMRVELSDTRIETSHLAFSHFQHLDPKGIESPEGPVQMSCRDCHEPDEAGKNMRPIRMTQHCQSCHELNFDEHEPNRTVPHADPSQVVTYLNEFFSRQYLEGLDKQQEKPSYTRTARRPGTVLTSEQREHATRWAQVQTNRVAQELFEKRVCADCHQLDVNPVTHLWTIKPVLLNQDWLPKAQFSHKAHQSTDCLDCHDAKLSESNEAILMPKMAVCTECHGSENSTNKLASNCITCHQYHPDKTHLDVSYFTR